MIGLVVAIVSSLATYQWFVIQPKVDDLARCCSTDNVGNFSADQWNWLNRCPAMSPGPKQDNLKGDEVSFSLYVRNLPAWYSSTGCSIWHEGGVITKVEEWANE